ncbi:MAG: hypothetical protein ACOYPR_20805, partial [Saprospiraceae bacterium]
MTKLLSISVLLLLLSAACNSNIGPKRPDTNTANLPKSGPAEDELLETLQGKWLSDQDSTYVIEFIGNKMRHLNGNQLTMEVDVEINGACDQAPCVSEQPGTETDGWCFTEKEKDGTVQCNVVTAC